MSGLTAQPVSPRDALERAERALARISDAVDCTDVDDTACDCPACECAFALDAVRSALSDPRLP